MATRINTTLSAVLAAVLLCAVHSYAFAEDDVCDRRPQKIKVKIKVKNNTPTKVVKGFFGSNADTLRVCPGDSIEWKYQSKGFFIDFRGATPFDVKKKNSGNGKVTWTIRRDAERGASYKYDIGIVDGGRLDPVIIIEGINSP